MPRVTVAVDCGLVVDPDNMRVQVEGGAAFALNALFHSEITMVERIVEQANSDGYPLLRYSEMPEVRAVLVASDAPPSGIGEPPVPALGAAASNAYRAATGTRIRRLPLARAGVV